MHGWATHTHLGERLRERELVAILEELGHRRAVAHEVARREALVRAVEDREELLLLHEGAELRPLLGRGVDASGVVRARVQQEEGALGRGVDVLHHAGEVEAARRRIVVAELDLLDAGVAPDVVVVGPRRRGDVDFGAGREALHELGDQAAGAGAR